MKLEAGVRADRDRSQRASRYCWRWCRSKRGALWIVKTSLVDLPALDTFLFLFLDALRDFDFEVLFRKSGILCSCLSECFLLSLLNLFGVESLSVVV